jgi:hypothetical protein
MRVAQPLLRLTLKRQFAGYCTTLKQVLESAPPADGSPTHQRAGKVV